MITVPLPSWAVASLNGLIGFVIGIIVAVVGAWLFYRQPAQTRSRSGAPTEKVRMQDKEWKRGSASRRPPPRQDPPPEPSPPPPPAPPPPQREELTDGQAVTVTRQLFAAADKVKAGESVIDLVTGT